MKPGFRFHPKALLLSGPKKAMLTIGSGNLTFGGWRENGEVWVRYDTEGDGRSRIVAFQQYLDDCLDLVALSDSIRVEISEAFDPMSKEWAIGMPEPEGLLGRAGKGESLIAQIRALVDRQPDRLYVCAPYFDPEGEALRTLISELSPKQTTLLVQSSKTNLLASVAAELESDCELRSASFRHSQQLAGESHSREAFLHAKFFGVEVDGMVTVLAGSANCSRAALTIPGAGGNAELVVVHRCSRDEFENAYLSELLLSDDPIEFSPDSEEPTPEPRDAESLRISAARMEGMSISVAFHASSEVEVSHAELDDEAIEIGEQQSGHVCLRTTLRPRTVRLVGRTSSGEIRSNLHWIDNEIELRASARGRSLAESIDQHVRSDAWSIGAWTDVLKELHKHLQYMPKTLAGSRAVVGRSEEERVPVEFQWEDVFSDGYGLRVQPIIAGFRFDASTQRVNSLRSMLLRWFGIGHEDERPELDDSESLAGVPEDDVGGDPDVDKPERLPAARLESQKSPPTDRQRKRALSTVRDIAKQMSNPDFLAERRPEMLAGDLKVASVLLRAGLKDEWLSAEEFFDETMRIWLPLFFSAADDQNAGWLENRYETSADPQQFQTSLRSAELAAALGCWALSTPDEAASSAHAWFDLASALGVARLPWLWQTGGNTAISKEIAAILALTSQGDDREVESTERRWRTLIRRGFALGRLESAAAACEIGPMRDRIAQSDISEGELLWQGRVGFCVAKE